MPRPPSINPGPDSAQLFWAGSALFAAVVLIGLASRAAEMAGQYGWVMGLPPSERAAFLRDLRKALGMATHGESEAFEATLARWRATAESYSDPDVAKAFTGPYPTRHKEVSRPGAVAHSVR